MGAVLFQPGNLILRAMFVAWLVAVAGCASRTPDAPPVVVSASTWRLVDRDIAAASLAATDQARSYAQNSMEDWMDLVYKRTDTDFIPWFSSYWTRQWLSMKVAWYRMSSDGEKEQTVNRLAGYLQEEYNDRVLDPVAGEIDPDGVMAQATSLYVRQLDERLKIIPQRHGVPMDQFDQHLRKIPAIELAPPPEHSASLYQLVHADPLEELPAYVALIDRIRNTPSGAGAWMTDSGLSSITQRTSEQLESEITTSGVASIIGTFAGRVAGTVISLGVAGFTAMAREDERPAMETRLRTNLNDAFDEEWLELMRNTDTGVMAGVFHLSGQIEGSLGRTETLPIQFEPVPRVVPLPGE
ncbi:hypothetical protein FQZ97_689270 [compost metagenome]